MIPYSRQHISEEDIQAVVEVLRSDFLTQGGKVPEFEAALAEQVGARHAVAVNSATSALHLACLALGVGPGDEVWTSPITFVASANAALFCGATVDFVDIDPATGNISVEALSDKLEAADRRGRIPKVVMPVHFAGQPCDMAAIAALADRYGFQVIEDASHALGASVDGRLVGGCSHSHITVFSFHPVKMITTGEGGAALTNNATLADRMALLRSHGVTRDAERLERISSGGWYYEQQALGFNYRLTDLQAALGASQLRRLPTFVAQRRALADVYDALLQHLPVKPLRREPYALSSWHLYVVRVPETKRRQAFDALRDEAVGVNVHYIPVHTQPYYQRLGLRQGSFPLSEQFYRQALTLPLFPELTAGAQSHVVDNLTKVLVD